MKTLLVAGYRGVNGRAVTAWFQALDGWRVKTLSRNEDAQAGDTHISVDLLDREAVRARRDDFADVDAVFYAALKPADDPVAEADENAAMFEHLIETVADASERLERVVFLQGGKVYGAHLGIYQTPARENDSRHFPPNLYFRQEDFCREQAARLGFSWTALRPDIVVGHSLGSAMNLGNLIGVYGALCRELGIAMQFPGPAAAMDVLVNVTDADIVAQAAQWSIEAGKDGAYNITNGDVFRWKHVWPLLTERFGCPAGEPQPIALATRLPSQEPAWQALQKRHGLEQIALGDIAQGGFGDFIFHVTDDAIFDVGHARRAGFDAMVRRSDESLLAHVDSMRDAGLIPTL